MRKIFNIILFTPIILFSQSVVIQPNMGNQLSITGIAGTYVFGESEFQEPPFWNYRQRLINKININDNGTDSPNMPPIAPNNNLYNTTCEFVIQANFEYLYIIVKVTDPNVVGLETVSGAGIELYFNNDSVRTESLTPAGNSTLNPIRDARIIINYQGEGMRFPTLQNGLSVTGIPLTNNDIDCTINSAPFGYYLITKIRVNALLGEYINTVTGSFNNPYRQIFYANRLGFDIANNISNGTQRVAQTMWNQCCYNTNYKQSAYYGYIIFNICYVVGLRPYEIGVKLQEVEPNKKYRLSYKEYYQNLCKSIDYTLQYKIIGSRDRSFLVGGSFLKPTDSLWRVSTYYDLEGLKNDVITIIGYSHDLRDTITVTFSGISEPQSMVINSSPSTLDAPFETAQFSASISPLAAYQKVTWSLVSTNLAVINSVTGLLTATSLGDGVVTVIGMSVIDSTVWSSYELKINACKKLTDFMISVPVYSTPCLTSNNEVSLVGYNIGDELTITGLMNYETTEGLKHKTIPDDFITYSATPSQASSVNISKNSIKINSNYSSVTLLGTYMNGYQKKFVLRQISSGTLSCSQTFNIDTLNTCNAITGIEQKNNPIPISIFPNPSTGIFNIISNSHSPIEVSVFNILGTEIMQPQSFINHTEINLSAFTKGMYIIKTQTANGHQSFHKVLLD
jgi:hypothetical protein